MQVAACCLLSQGPVAVSRERARHLPVTRVLNALYLVMFASGDLQIFRVHQKVRRSLSRPAEVRAMAGSRTFPRFAPVHSAADALSGVRLTVGCAGAARAVLAACASRDSTSTCSDLTVFWGLLIVLTRSGVTCLP
jgi:hypothetical protein